MISKEKEVLSTLIYSDLFDFPLSFDEIHELLVSNRKISKAYLKKVLDESKKIKKTRELYHLKGRDNIVSLRKTREKESTLKIREVSYMLKLIGFVPTVLLVGISGSVAFGNAKKSDDIDLFIVTKENSLWISRFLIIALLFVFNKKRSVGDKISQNKICVNMLLDETTLSINKRNVFIAKEIAQVLPVINKLNTYEKFLKKNAWINKYIANFNIPKSTDARGAQPNFIIDGLDSFLFNIQRKYMLSKITNEKIGKHFAWFHPDDKSKQTIEKFKEKTLQMNTIKRREILKEKHSQKTTSYNTFVTPGY